MKFILFLISVSLFPINLNSQVKWNYDIPIVQPYFGEFHTRGYIDSTTNETYTSLISGYPAVSFQDYTSVFKFDSSGTLIWQKELPNKDFSAPKLHFHTAGIKKIDNQVLIYGKEWQTYKPTQHDAATIYSLDDNSGAINWSYTFENDSILGSVFRDLEVFDNKIFTILQYSKTALTSDEFNWSSFPNSEIIQLSLGGALEVGNTIWKDSVKKGLHKELIITNQNLYSIFLNCPADSNKSKAYTIVDFDNLNNEFIYADNPKFPLNRNNHQFGHLVYELNNSAIIRLTSPFLLDSASQLWKDSIINIQVDPFSKALNVHKFEIKSSFTSYRQIRDTYYNDDDYFISIAKDREYNSKLNILITDKKTGIDESLVIDFGDSLLISYLYPPLISDSKILVISNCINFNSFTSNVHYISSFDRSGNLASLTKTFTLSHNSNTYILDHLWKNKSFEILAYFGDNNMLSQKSISYLNINLENYLNSTDLFLIKSSDRVTFFPNPIKNNNTVSFSSPVSSLSIYTSTGALVQQTGETPINSLTLNLPEGVYFMEYYHQQQRFTQKLIIKN